MAARSGAYDDLTTVRGRFKEFTGTVLVDEQNPGVLVGHAVKIEIEAQAVKEDGSPLAPDG